MTELSFIAKQDEPKIIGKKTDYWHKQDEQDDVLVDDNNIKGNCLVGWLERVIDTPADLPQGQWLRRLCCNKWLRTCAYGIVCMNCCAIYYGWHQFQKVLFRGGVYSWLCTDKDQHIGNENPCDAQNAQVQTLYAIATSMESVFGVIAGVSLDHLGPRSCGLLGLGVLFLGVILLIFSSQSFQAYIPSMILLGGSVNLVAFPALLAGDFFPRNNALVLAFIVSCQIGCSLVGIVLLEIMRLHPTVSLNSLFFGYLAFAWAPCCVLYFFFLPCRRRVSPPHAAAAASIAVGQESTTADFDQKNRSIELFTTADPTSPSTANSENQTEMTQVDRDSEHANTMLSKRRHSRNQELLEPAPLIEDKPAVMKGDWKDFFRELRTWEVEIFGVYYMLQSLQFVYYTVTPFKQYGEHISDFAGYITPTQAVWGLGFGWLVDQVGTLPLCYLMNTLNVLVFSFMLTGVYYLQYATASLNCIAASFIYTSKYTYVAEIYSPSNFGKLSGYIGFCGRVFTLLNIPIGASTNFNLWSIVSLGVSGFCYVLITILAIRQRQGINHLKLTAAASSASAIQPEISLSVNPTPDDTDKAE